MNYQEDVRTPNFLLALVLSIPIWGIICGTVYLLISIAQNH